jgi:hypothetical protein
MQSNSQVLELLVNITTKLLLTRDVKLGLLAHCHPSIALESIDMMIGTCPVTVTAKTAIRTHLWAFVTVRQRR